MSCTMRDYAVKNITLMSSVVDKYTMGRAGKKCVENDLVMYRHDEP
jgi:hypothetical protein